MTSMLLSEMGPWIWYKSTTSTPRRLMEPLRALKREAGNLNLQGNGMNLVAIIGAALPSAVDFFNNRPMILSDSPLP